MPNLTVNTHEAKTHFSKLLVRVSKGEEIIVAKSGKPVARLLPYEKPEKTRVPGKWKGKYPRITKTDILEPLPEEELRNWEN